MSQVMIAGFMKAYLHKFIVEGEVAESVVSAGPQSTLKAVQAYGESERIAHKHGVKASTSSEFVGYWAPLCAGKE